jgi:hypothetical protein
VLKTLFKLSTAHWAFQRQLVLQIDLLNHAGEAEVDVAF